MRFVWAVAAFVLATVMIGAGIAQRTVLLGPKTYTQAIEVDESAPYVLIDGGVLQGPDLALVDLGDVLELDHGTESEGTSGLWGFRGRPVRPWPAATGGTPP